MNSKRSYSAQDVSRLISHRSNEMYLLESSYINYKTKCTFIDVEYGPWECKPGNIVNKGYSHPARKKSKTKATFQANYGVDNPMKSKEVADRVKNTMIDRYGVDNPMKSKEIQDKTKSTMIERYGVDNPSKNKSIIIRRSATNIERYGGNAPASDPVIKDKIKSTVIERYGGTAPSQNEEVKNKMKSTSVVRYGVDNPAKSEIVKQKTVKTNMDRYGKPFTCLDQNNLPSVVKYTDLDGNSIRKVCAEKNINYDMASKIYAKRGQQACLDWIDNFQKNITDIESIFIDKLGLTKFDKMLSQDLKHKPDFKISDTLFLEADGLYWHSEEKKSKQYHFNKRKKFEESGLRTLQFYSNEIFNKIDIIVSIVNNLSGKSARLISGRECIVKSVPPAEAESFLNKSHMMGSCKSRHVGLFWREELVCIMSYKIKDSIIKIDRFCNALNSNVRGGFSKLLKKVIASNPEAKEVHNWVDLRYGVGTHLESKGFKMVKETLGWRWTDYHDTFNRLQCRANMDDRKLSEKQHAEEMGWVKIYDAGQRLYVLKLDERSHTIHAE